MAGHDQVMGDARSLANRLDGAGWGLFLVWMGVAVLANLGWGVGLLGVGVIALGAQVARKSLGLSLEWFWLAIGIVFVVWGVWEQLRSQLGEAPFGLLPILCIVIGLVSVASALLRKPQAS